MYIWIVQTVSNMSCVRACRHANSLQSWPFVTLWTVACQAPLTMGFSRQEFQRRLPCPSPGDLPDPEIEPLFQTSPALAGGFFTTSATWEVPVIHHLMLLHFVSKPLTSSGQNSPWSFLENHLLRCNSQANWSKIFLFFFFSDWLLIFFASIPAMH